MTRSYLGVGLAFAILAATLTSAPPAVAADAPVVADARAIQMIGTNSPFSPNADGVKDRAEIRYRLDRPARVTLVVRRAGKTIATLNPGHQRKGRHSVTWGGRRHGKPVRDGRYRVIVRAGSATAHTSVVVDTRSDVIGNGTVAMSSDTVYPRTTVIHDVVVGNLLPDYEVLDVSRPPHVYGSDDPTPEELAVAPLRSQVLDQAGRVVDSAPVEPATTRPFDLADLDSCAFTCARFTWDGRDDVGRIMPVGAYRIRIVHGRDKAGNPRLLARPVEVRVSRAMLRARTTTTTSTAAETVREPHEYGGCNGCPERVCNTVPSERFAGGLSYRSREIPSADNPFFCVAYDWFTVPTPGRRTPYDRFRVAVTGGPAIAGTAATVTLRAGWSGQSSTMTTTGDNLTTINGRIAPNTEPNREMFVQPVSWGIYVSDGNAYDVASFTVTQTTYAPAT